MSTPKFLTTPAESHGLTDRIVDPHFDALVKGQPVGMVPAMVLLKPISYGGQTTTKGTQRHVKYELARVEPSVDGGDRDNAMWQIQALYEARTSTGSQRPLPIGLPTEERRQALMERIEDTSAELGMTGGELEEKWRAHFGFQEGGGTDRQFDIPGDYRKAGVTQLLEFAISLGADDEATEPPNNLPELGEDGQPVDGSDGPADDDQPGTDE